MLLIWLRWGRIARHLRIHPRPTLEALQVSSDYISMPTRLDSTRLDSRRRLSLGHVTPVCLTVVDFGASSITRGRADFGRKRASEKRRGRLPPQDSGSPVVNKIGCPRMRSNASRYGRFDCLVCVEMICKRRDFSASESSEEVLFAIAKTF